MTMRLGFSDRSKGSKSGSPETGRPETTIVALKEGFRFKRLIWPRGARSDKSRTWMPENSANNTTAFSSAIENLSSGWG